MDRRWIIAGAAVGGLALAPGAFVASAYLYARVQRDTVADGVVVAGAAVGGAGGRRAVSARVIASALAIGRVPSRDGAALMSGILTQVLERRLADPDSLRTFKLPVKIVHPKVTTAGLAKKYPVFLTVCRGCFQLRLWKNLKVAKIYPIAVGRQGLETPAGLYTINDKQIDPSWHVPQ